MPLNKRLLVFRGKSLVGYLANDDPLSFTYADTWLHIHGRSITPTLDASQQIHSGESVESYFENLLPEAGIRELLKLKHQCTSTFGLLNAIGGDTASDLSIMPEGAEPTRDEYLLIDWKDVANYVYQGQGPMHEAYQEHGIRISLAGAQKKNGVVINHAGILLLPLKNTPSTHIVKPDIQGIDGVWSSAINETFIMRLAQTINLGVASARFEPIAKACVIERYDRWLDGDRQIQKIHQLDLCQLADKPSTIKYEADGGPNLKRCHQLLKQHGISGNDMKRFLQWIFFNLFVGNNDSHAKNISVYFPPGQHIGLAPFYDLLCTAIYPGLSNHFAFSIGGESRPSHLNRNNLTQMAIELGYKPAFVMQIAQTTANAILKHCSHVANECQTLASVGSEKTMIERLEHYVCSNTQKLQNRLLI